MKYPIVTLTVLGVALTARLSAAETRNYVIAIGNNAPPIGSVGVPRLSYADDDATSFVEFARSFAEHTVLLTVLDPESQQRFPGAAAIARTPTLVELRAVLADFRTRFATDRQQGKDPVLFLFFSGHGMRDERGASLALVDGSLTRQILYEEILATLPARYVHIFVDACHAEAWARPRDASAAVVDVTAAESNHFVAEETLARFPHVGAILATTAGEQAHEWDGFEGGVFTHELLSGLRGAADVNGDRTIEYSELHAFLAAANREVADPRAQLHVVVHAPPVNLHAPLVELARLRDVGWAVQQGGSPFFIEGPLGERLVDVHLETNHRVVLAVPASQQLFYRRLDDATNREATFSVNVNQVVQLDRLRLHGAHMVARDAVAAALTRGLFVVPFGPAYYRGFVDRAGEVSVAFTRPTASAPSHLRRTTGLALLGSAALLGAGAAVLGGLALHARTDYPLGYDQRLALYQSEGTFSLVLLSAGAVAAVVGLALAPWRRVDQLSALSLGAAPTNGGFVGAASFRW